MRNLKSIEHKIHNLPPTLIDEVELYLDFLLQKFKVPPKGKLKQSWAGALKEYRSEFTSIELQKKALDWRSK